MVEAGHLVFRLFLALGAAAVVLQAGRHSLYWRRKRVGVPLRDGHPEPFPGAIGGAAGAVGNGVGALLTIQAGEWTGQGPTGSGPAWLGFLLAIGLGGVFGAMLGWIVYGLSRFVLKPVVWVFVRRTDGPRS